MPNKRNNQTMRKPRKQQSTESQVQQVIQRAAETTATQVFRHVISDITNFTMPTAVGTTRIVRTSDPTADTEFSDFLALYQEYRTIAIGLEWVPGLAGSYLNPTVTTTGFDYRPWLTIENRGSTLSASLTPAIAAEYADTLQVSPLNQRWKRAMRATQSSEMQWTNTNASPASPFEIGATTDSYYAPIVTGATGIFLTKMVVEFRGRR